MDIKLRADLNSGTSAVREGFELDSVALDAWLADHVPGYAGPLRIEQFKGGQSNPTYKLITPATAYVLRAKPKGELLKSAHAVDREYRVISALGPAGVPAPQALALCTDDQVIGRWFYVMSFSAGPVVWDLPSDRWTPGQRASIWRAGVDAAIRLHSVDYARVGLDDFGKVGGYVARQLRRWGEQYDYTRDGIHNPAMDHLIPWLAERLPATEPTTVVHGDLQLSNMILEPSFDGVAAIIDWELATLGNPISDFAYFCRDYHVPAGSGGFAGAARTLGVPPEAEVITRWSTATGYAVGDDWMFYVIFNMFRLAAIRQGVAKRIKDGTATSANAGIAAQGAVDMATAAWDLARRIG